MLGIGDDLDGQIGLATEEAQRPARIVADQRFAQAQHHFAEHLVAVSSERIDGMKHESVIRRHDLLDQHCHQKIFIGNMAGPARQVGTFVPLGSPDPTNAVPGLLPRNRRQTALLPDGFQGPAAVRRAPPARKAASRNWPRTAAGCRPVRASSASYSLRICSFAGLASVCSQAPNGRAIEVGRRIHSGSRPRRPFRLFDFPPTCSGVNRSAGIAFRE